MRPEETLGRYPHQLSGGQRQRMMVARALLLQPRLIIADEPVSMVDASLRATILESLQKLHTDFGISFLYITHDLTTAYQISDNIIVLYRGGVAEVGDVDLVIKHPQHPYSQLLISSIPMPDVDDRWDDDDQSLASRAEPGARGDALAVGSPTVARRSCRCAPRRFRPCIAPTTGGRGLLPVQRHAHPQWRQYGSGAGAPRRGSNAVDLNSRPLWRRDAASPPFGTGSCACHARIGTLWRSRPTPASSGLARLRWSGASARSPRPSTNWRRC